MRAVEGGLRVPLGDTLIACAAIVVRVDLSRFGQLASQPRPAGGASNAMLGCGRG